MGFAGLCGVMRGVMSVTACGVRVVSRFLVLPTLTMLSGFAMMARGMSVVLGCEVFGCFLRHKRLL